MSFAQKMTLDVRDSIYNRKIDLDSIHIYNAETHTDVTIFNPGEIKYDDIVGLNSVIANSHSNISLQNNQLTVKSNERIENIKMFDLLGREVINANVNNTNYQTNINSENNSLFYFISIRTDKGLYNSKLINSTYDDMQIANVMPTSSNWIFTLYKFGYNTENIEFVNFPDAINLKMKRIVIKMDVDFTIYNLYFKYLKDIKYIGDAYHKYDYKYIYDYKYLNDTNKYKFQIYLFQDKSLAYTKKESSHGLIYTNDCRTFPGDTADTYDYIVEYPINNSLEAAIDFVNVSEIKSIVISRPNYLQSYSGGESFANTCITINFNKFNLNKIFDGTSNEIVLSVLDKQGSDEEYFDVYFGSDNTWVGMPPFPDYLENATYMSDESRVTGTITFELEK